MDWPLIQSSDKALVRFEKWHKSHHMCQYSDQEKSGNCLRSSRACLMQQGRTMNSLCSGQQEGTMGSFFTTHTAHNPKFYSSPHHYEMQLYPPCLTDPQTKDPMAWGFQNPWLYPVTLEFSHCQLFWLDWSALWCSQPKRPQSFLVFSYFP